MHLHIQTKTNIEVGDFKYEIEYPNVGQTIEIENLKILLSGNMYSSLIKSNHKTGEDLLNLIDGVSYFTVLAKDFKENFGNDFTKLDFIQQAYIKKAFAKQFWPWFLKIQEEINKIVNPEDYAK